ncbi:MAG: CBS domain-containing protein [Anaerolineae bacterium]
MKCPACGSDNTHGADVCAECGASLTHEDHPMPTTGAHHSIMTDLISDLNPRSPISVSVDASVADAIDTMLNASVGCVLVTDAAGKLAGIFSETDAVRRVAGKIDNLSEASIQEVITRRPSTLPADVPIAHALHLMGLHGFRHIPLVDADGRPQGVISSRDIAEFIEENFTP